MIELRGLHKYYNKGKPNELHVLDGISLSFAEKGFVAICGHSGSGKTTLLNCIGGIDDFDKGTYVADGKAIGGRKLHKIIDYKRGNIGFVFQEYNLIEDLSVEANILTALDIAGFVKNTGKVNIVLEAVGMAKYNKRKVNTLSGGQKQRVAIARALVINPKVILADEPTGNLDRANSVQIMELLKGISAEILVLLVSHERTLVNDFADRIIEIDNARVLSDRINTEAADGRAADGQRHGGKIYLGDLERKKFDAGGISLNIYYAGNSAFISELNVVINGEKTIVYGDGDISTDKEPIAEGKAPICAERKPETSLQISVRDKLERCGGRSGGKRRLPLRGGILTSGIKKSAAVVIAAAAVFVAISMSFLDKATTIDPVKFRESDLRQIALSVSANGDIAQINAIAATAGVTAVLPYTHPVSLSYVQKGIMQANVANAESIQFFIKPLPISLIGETDIVYGRMPQNNFEAVWDKFFIDKILAGEGGSYGRSALFGVITVQSFLGAEILFSGDMRIKVVGISDVQSPALYMHSDLLYSVCLYETVGIEDTILTENLTDYIKTDIKFDSDDEIYLSQKEYMQAGFIDGDPNQIVIMDEVYEVKGFYEPEDMLADINARIISSERLKYIVYKQLSYFYNIELVVKDKEAAINYFHDRGIIASDLYKTELDRYVRDNNGRMILQLILTVLISAAAIIIFYFVTKANILERNKETAVKLALGIRKRKIYLDFIGNSLIFFCLFALPAYLISTGLIGAVLTAAPGLLPTMSVTVPNVLIGIIILMAMPLVITMLPLLKYLRKKPVDLLRE
ncbi:MAG: ABC transporter ATP-binding protein/permease [Clostridiales bacterium]|jgi:ABC-type lipoprotein export system ATPase subunit|nr:ABC transporter ATP-binding protein/permease [Clostridiales bacterium]